MSPEHRVTDGPALFGKHPGHGDFVSAGMPEGLGLRLSDWLGATLGEVREQLGPGWQHVLDNPVGLRFWLGSAIGEGVAWRGVMRMSGDKVGRRYPLIAMQPTAPESLPVVQVQQDFFLDAEAALSDLLAAPTLVMAEVETALTTRLGHHAPEGAGLAEHMFWAIKPGLAIEELCTEVALSDLISAASTRSYWWFVHETAGQSGILACNGLPGAQALAWLISGGEPAENQ